MIPEEIEKKDNFEEVREKLIRLFDDVYSKFNQLQEHLFDFAGNVDKIGQNVTSTGESIDDLDQDITDPPTEDEVQDISDKIDDILLKLRDSNLIGD